MSLCIIHVYVMTLFKKHFPVYSQMTGTSSQLITMSGSYGELQAHTHTHTC